MSFFGLIDAEVFPNCWPPMAAFSRQSRELEGMWIVLFAHEQQAPREPTRGQWSESEMPRTSFRVSFAALLAAGTLLAAPAMAADVVEPAPAEPMVIPPVNTWDGPYAGVSLGYGFSGKTNTPTGDYGTDGFVGGAFAGYNFQNGMFVYGGEADVNYSNLTGNNAFSRSKTGVDGSLRARLGVAVTDDVLLYGTAGGAAQRLKISDAAGSDSNPMLGWTAGGGVDLKLTEKVFGRVEYRYTDFGSKDFNTGSGPQSVDSSENRVSVGLGMKF
jgi:outer membrane immunogenic protein